MDLHFVLQATLIYYHTNLLSNRLSACILGKHSMHAFVAEHLNSLRQPTRVTMEIAMLEYRGRCLFIDK